MKFHRLVLVGLLASPAFLTAQERITIGLAPRSGQVLASHTAMETVMDLAPDAAADAAPPVALPKMNMVMTMSSSGTTTVGVPDEEGRYEVRSSMDDVSTTMTMNGQPMPFNLPQNPLSGQNVTVTFNRDRRMVDMTAPGLDTTAADAVKKMITTIAGIASPVTLAIGETSTIPMNVALPVPANASGGIGMSGDIRMTLVSITPEGADRIAHLTTTITSQVNGPRAPAGGESRMTLQMSGEGTMDVNVDRGFAKATQMEIKIATTMPIPGRAGASMPPVQMHGTMKMSTTTESR